MRLIARVRRACEAASQSSPTSYQYMENKMDKTMANEQKFLLM